MLVYLCIEVSEHEYIHVSLFIYACYPSADPGGTNPTMAPIQFGYRLWSAPPMKK